MASFRSENRCSSRKKTPQETEHRRLSGHFRSTPEGMASRAAVTLVTSLSARTCDRRSCARHQLGHFSQKVATLQLWPIHSMLRETDLRLRGQPRRYPREVAKLAW